MPMLCAGACQKKAVGSQKIWPFRHRRRSVGVMRANPAPKTAAFVDLRRVINIGNCYVY